MTIPPSPPSENTPLKRKAIAQRPLLVITLYSWFVPILLLLVFLLGIIIGYFLHPSTTASPSAQLLPQASPTTAALSQAQRQRFMEMLSQKTEHYQGSAQAAILMFEFGDFQ